MIFFSISFNKTLSISLFGLIFLAGLSSVPAQAQSDIQVSMGAVHVFNDAIAEVPFQVTGNGASRGLQLRLDFDDNHISSVDLSDCLDGFVGVGELGTLCSQPAGQPGRIRLLLNAGHGEAINDFTGTLRFQLDGTMPAETTTALQWDNVFATATNPAAGTSLADGLITSEGPEPVPGQLMLDKTEIDFGGANPGQSVYDTVIVSNVAAAGSQSLALATLDVSGAGFVDTGAGTCSPGTVLPPQGPGCSIEVEFQPNGVGDFHGSLAVVTSDAQLQQTILLGKGTPIPAEIFIDDLHQTYTGSPLTPTITTDPSGLGVVVTYDGQPDPPTEVGTYLVEVQIDEANYTGSNSALFNIVSDEVVDGIFDDRFEG